MSIEKSSMVRVAYLNLHQTPASRKTEKSQASLLNALDLPDQNRKAPRLSSPINTLHKAAEQGNISRIKELLAGNANINETNHAGTATVLKAAAQMGPLSKVGALLATNSLSANNGGSVTPLHLAARNGNIEAVDTLLAANADLLAVTETGLTALEIASLSNHPQLTKLLAQREHMNTTLHTAAKSGHLRRVEILLKAGANPNTTTAADGVSPLHLAVMNNRMRVTSALIEAGADLRQTTPEGLTPIALAHKAKHEKMTQYLVEKAITSFHEGN